VTNPVMPSRIRQLITVESGLNDGIATPVVIPPEGRPMMFKPWVTAVDPRRYLEWSGRAGMPGIFDGRHSFTLTPLTGGRTLLQQSETFSGALVPFAGPLLARTRLGFDQMNEALGHRLGASRDNPSGSPGTGTPESRSSR
jgi:hypothetical protein